LAIQTKDGFHLYDATSKQSAIDQLPPRDWNQFGILMAKEKVQQLTMENTKPSFTYLTVDAKINDDGSVSGSYSDKDTGTYAMFAKENYDDNADKYKKQYKENFSVIYQY
jgi:hypothetical protein